jgi:hypothetical protein
MQMTHSDNFGCPKQPAKRDRPSKRYERFGEVIRYLTVEELQQFFDSIDNSSQALELHPKHGFLSCREHKDQVCTNQLFTQRPDERNQEYVETKGRLE